MLDMCLVNCVFLQANSCPISEMKSIRHKCVSQRRKEEETIVCNRTCLQQRPADALACPKRPFSLVNMSSYVPWPMELDEIC
jgi:hypothetical protein